MDKEKWGIDNPANFPGWVPDNGNGTFKNPVLFADYSDPDVVRVGKDFFLTASSFNCTPGLPILHSHDLVNWRIVNYAVDKLPFTGYDQPRHGCGVWAPSLCYHDGLLWIYFAMPDEGIFMTRTRDPFGKWEPLVCVKKVRGWIDPCPFWDDDGQAYLVNAFAKSRIGFKSVLNISRMNSEGTEIGDEGKFIIDRDPKHPTIEGPKMYKRNGFYYIFAPAGGVPAGWQTVLRSKQIFGPYEDKIVLHQGNTPVNGPHQGGWVELESGESWFMHFQDAGAYGRIVHLQPVKWADDWPSMGEDYNADGIGEPVMTCRKPDVGATYPVAVPQTSDDFDSDQAGLQWQWHANTKENWYSLTARKSYMRLYAINPSLNNEQITLWDAPNLLLQKFPAPCFAATTRLDFSGAAFQDKAGLIVMGQEYAFIALNKTLTDIRLILVKGEGVEDLRRETVVTSVVLSSPTVYLRVNVQQDNERRAHCTFCYSLDGDTYTDLEYLFEAKPGKWLGSKTGIFCCNLEQTASTGYADFDSFVCS